MPARSRTKKDGTKIYKARDIKKGIRRDPLIEELKVYVASSTKVPKVWAKMQGAVLGVRAKVHGVDKPT